MARRITPQEQLFAEHYCLTRNGRQSAILAGYSESNASVAAQRLLKRSRVLEEISRFESVLLTQTSVSRQQMEAFYLKIMAEKSTATVDQKLRAADQLCRLKGYYLREIDLLLAEGDDRIRQAVASVRDGQVINVPAQIVQENGKQ